MSQLRLESLTDRVEEIIVRFLQSNPTCGQLEIEQAVYGELRGLFTPSMGIVSAILHSYAQEEGANWTLRAGGYDRKPPARPESDRVHHRRHRQTTELQDPLTGKVAESGRRTECRGGRSLCGRQRGWRMQCRRNPVPVEDCVLVLPGGRAALIAYKAQRDPAFAERLKLYRLAKYRLWRTLSEAPILTRETFEEQLASDPIERSHGQMIMF